MTGDRRHFDAGVIDVLFEDASRYRLAWLGARKRAFVRGHIIRNLRTEADQRQHQLLAELDRNKALNLRIYELETELVALKARLG